MSDTMPALEELRAIRRMLAETRRSTERHWIGLVIWGVPGFLAALASHRSLASSREDLVPLVWVGFWIAGFLLAALYGVRDRRRTRVVTTAARILDVTWFAVIMTMMLLLSTGLVPPPYLPSVIAIVLATGLCIMGAVLEFRPLYAAAALWWIGGLVMVRHPREAFAIDAILILFGYLLPAAMLWRLMVREDAVDAAD